MLVGRNVVIGSSRSKPPCDLSSPQDTLAVRLLPAQCHAAVKSTRGDVLLCRGHGYPDNHASAPRAQHMHDAVDHAPIIDTMGGFVSAR
jgi:hypothetical protein